MESKMNDLVILPTAATAGAGAGAKGKSSAKAYAANDYLDEYDHYYFEHEKYLQAGHGGKQRNKKEVELNSNKYDPSGNVRVIINKMHNFEQNRRK